MENNRNSLLDCYILLLQLEGKHKQLCVAYERENLRRVDQLGHRPPVSSDEREERISSLKDELFLKKAINHTKEVACERLQLSDALWSIINADFPIVQEEKDGLERDMVRLNNLAKEIQDADINLQEAQESLLKLEKTAHALTKQRQQLWKELNDREPTEPPATPDENLKQRLKDLEARTKMEKQSVRVSGSILRNLIVGSKVNWAKDPTLLNLFLSLGKNTT